MKYVFFDLAGDHSQHNDCVFLMSRNRKYSKNAKAYEHRNDYTTHIIFDMEFFKKNFKYDRLNGVYRTDLRYQDIKQFMTVEKALYVGGNF